MDKRDIKMVETITLRNLPDEFFEIYETDGVKNIMENRFTELDSNTACWHVTGDFQFESFLMK